MPDGGIDGSLFVRRQTPERPREAGLEPDQTGHLTALPNLAEVGESVVHRPEIPVARLPLPVLRLEARDRLRRDPLLDRDRDEEDPAPVSIHVEIDVVRTEPRPLQDGLGQGDLVFGGTLDKHGGIPFPWERK